MGVGAPLPQIQAKHEENSGKMSKNLGKKEKKV